MMRKHLVSWSDAEAFRGCCREKRSVSGNFHPPPRQSRGAAACSGAQRLLGVDGSSRPFGSCVRCTNPECQVLWCTECLGEAHTGPCTTGIPITGDLDSLRRYVEAEMAVALVRRCPSCAARS